MGMNNEMTIANALRSLDSIADDIVFVDGGSTDGTIEIASEFCTKILTRKWDGHHSEQRNVYLRYLIEHFLNHWAFVLDSDETLDRQSGDAIEKVIATVWTQRFWLRRKWLIGLKPSRFIASPPHYPDWQLRLFRISEDISYTGQIHEALTNRGNNSGSGRIASFVVRRSVLIRAVSIYHLDLLINSFAARRQKVMTYERMGEGNGLPEYYLPERNLSTIDVSQDDSDLFLQDSFIQSARPHSNYWSNVLKKS